MNDGTGIASAALLRDLHLGLLSVLDGSAATFDAKVQPPVGRPPGTEGFGPFWPERVHDAIAPHLIDKGLMYRFPELLEALKVLCLSLVPPPP